MLSRRGSTVLETELSWRRISDWKTTVTLVRIAEVPAELMRDAQLVAPAERIRGVAPQLAELATPLASHVWSPQPPRS